jgi:hypothetical protein
LVFSSREILQIPRNVQSRDRLTVQRDDVIYLMPIRTPFVNLLNGFLVHLPPKSSLACPMRGHMSVLALEIEALLDTLVGTKTGLTTTIQPIPLTFVLMEGSPWEDFSAVGAHLTGCGGLFRMHRGV